MFLLDTDVLSQLRKRRDDAGVITWSRQQRTTDFYVSVVSIGEIERGITLQSTKAPDFAATLTAWLDGILAIYADRILPFDLETARRWGRLSAIIGNAGADLMIAATALERGLTVVTRNVSHFTPTGVATLNPFSGRS